MKIKNKNRRALIKRLLVTVITVIIILIIGVVLFFNLYNPPLSENHGKIDAQLFVGDSVNQPLIVAFGGSQGGNTWTEDYWLEMRNKFVEKGYAVLSIGYFNTKNTPEKLDRISINAIYDTIKKVSRRPEINENRIALLGSSRGGELVLNIASRYKDINAVVALVPSNVSFPAQTLTANTSAWTYNDKEIPYMKIPFKAFWASLQGDSQRISEIIIEEQEKTLNGVIKVEKINGPILLLSAKNDELWPSGYMSNQIENRLRENNLKYYYENYLFDGKHHDTKKYFDKVFNFLDEHFRSN
ncbi:acetylxylan esterase [Pontibacter sp. E15-1]|uniref:acyl-CoA thioester hydrolase/BAAT C-terminal domain-containing protein n=1 Tax=Pontibacter sp. E15-1 TaxID=2919918 RepID=UPI001F4FF866|nr:acyl-CoA thioester hydrolase/BAAT C-terminal domain-containing protein [Pontibacter sp. E15-1]MCJ8167104.1 acetylxylan esterase [Pontibacter sp. E15-1]